MRLRARARVRVALTRTQTLTLTMAHQFRALARNAAGISAPGGASPPTMVNRFYAALLEPPTPLATSSASYSVSWGATATLGACQPDVRWDPNPNPNPNLNPNPHPNVSWERTLTLALTLT